MCKNPGKAVIIGLLFAVFINSSACKKTPGPAAPAAGPTAVTPTPPQDQQAQSSPTPAVQTKYFKGSIGNALDLQMKLTREGDRLSGSYFYRTVGTKIDLKGTIDKDGSVALEEYDSGGKQTGLFKGLWKPDEDGLISIAGNWSKPNSDKKTAFSLHEEPIELSGGVEVVTRQIKENNKKLNYDIKVQYPELTASANARFTKFNQEVKNLVSRQISEFKKNLSSSEAEEEPTQSMGSDLNINYTIALAKDDLISIEFDASSYARGAAHPNSNSFAVNFDLKNGNMLKLGDLFKPGAKYLEAISSYANRDLKSQAKTQRPNSKSEDQIQSVAVAKNYQNWTISKKGLGITFDPYEVAAYAAGPQHVLIPYSALKNLVKPDGPVGQFVK